RARRSRARPAAHRDDAGRGPDPRRPAGPSGRRAHGPAPRPPARRRGPAPADRSHGKEGAPDGTGSAPARGGVGMKWRRFVMVVAVGFLGVLSGCAARTEAARASTSVAAQRPSQQLSGTWQGSFSKPGASIYADEGKYVLDIRPDGTFTASVTPNPASNSHAK